MKRFVLGFIAFAAGLLALAQRNPTPVPTPFSTAQMAYRSPMPDFGPAPEFTNESWLNTTVPLRLATLRGKVVLLDMWTFACINCIHITPYVQDWHSRYADQGLVVIGNHFPELSYERDLTNVRKALPELGITYVVAQDNSGATWDAWANRYWPTVYLIDKKGHLRYTHIGEGNYSTTEAAIQDLLLETYTSDSAPTTTPDTPLKYLTPGESITVRAAPDASAATLGSIEPQEAYIIRAEENGWYRIAYNDTEGFVPVTAVQANG